MRQKTERHQGAAERTIKKHASNVRYWHKADVPAYVDLCLLSGVKRTL
jgi:hypothetical protein